MTTPPMGGGAPDPVDPSGLINPDQFVCSWTTLDTSSIEAGASSLRTMGTKVRDEVQGMRMTWSSLPASYEGPEQELVYSLLDDPRDAAEDLKERLNSAAVQLDTYATVLFNIALDLMDLESEARDFRAEAQAGYTEETQYAKGGNSPNGTKTEHVSWNEHSTANEKNKTLLARYAGLIERISSAAAYCANAINEVQMGSVEAGFTPVTADEIMSSSEPMPWGSPVAEDRNCEESFWDGTGNFVKDTAVGATSLVGVDFDPTTSRKETAKQAWGGMADFGGSILIATTPVTYLAYVPALSDTQVGQFMKDRHHTAVTGVGSVVGWDEAEAAAGGSGWHAWKEDPVAAGTEAALNIGSFFIPIGGAAGAAGKTAASAGRAGRLAKGARGAKRVTGNVADLVIAGGSHIVDGATRVFSKGLETSRGRTGVVDNVDLDVTPVPGKHGDGSAPGRAADPQPQRDGADASPGPSETRRGNGESSDEIRGRDPESNLVAPGKNQHGPNGNSGEDGSNQSPQASEATADGRPESSSKNSERSDVDSSTEKKSVSKQWRPSAVEQNLKWEGPIKPTKTFPPKGVVLEGNTAYEVAGRGTYYTDASGRVAHVETGYSPTRIPNPDLNHPAPNTTYVVDDRHVFVTDAKARTVEVHAPKLEPVEVRRSGHIQRDVGGAAGPGHDGGHLIQNALGGGRERINIVAMLEELNRSGSRKYGSTANSYFVFEAKLRSAVERGSEVGLDLYVEYGSGRAPTSIVAESKIDGLYRQREFDNVRK